MMIWSALNKIRVYGKDLEIFVRDGSGKYRLNPLVVRIFLIYAPLAADSLAEYALYFMQDYLTDVWELSVAHAAGILNIWGGICKILPVFLVFFAHAYLGNYIMLAISSIAYSVGLGFISMSTPRVFSDSIDYAQRVLFYTGMALVAVGTSGISASTKRFIVEQIGKPDEKNKTIEYRPRILQIILVVLSSLTGALAIPYVKAWSLRFGIPAICTVVAMLLFLSGRVYEKTPPESSPLTAVSRVLVASAHKRSKSLQLDKSNLYYGDDKDKKSRELTETRCLGFLEKAAILVDGSSHEEQAKDKWRLCNVSEVEQAKTVIRMVPMWLTFIVVGIVSSNANTYFVEQASQMNPHIGEWDVPLPMILLFYNLVKQMYTYLHVDTLKLVRMHEPRIVIGLAMMQSVLCCITAAKIEGTRLKIVREDNSFDKPDYESPMSTYWLLFQFFLLAGVDSLFERGVISFYRNQAPESMGSYLKYMTKGVSGLGFMFSVIFVNKIIQKGRDEDWFQRTLNKSRLHKYYWLLAMISSVNLVAYIFVACFYTRRYKEQEQKEQMDDEAGGSV